MAISSDNGSRVSRASADSCSSAAISTARDCDVGSRVVRSNERMSQTDAAQFLLGTRGLHRDLDAFVVAILFDRSGGSAAFAMGDGSVHVVAVADKANWRKVDVHD